MTAATPDRAAALHADRAAALHAALQDTLSMARTAQDELDAQSLRERAARALLWRLKARADELRAQIATARRRGAA